MPEAPQDDGRAESSESPSAAPSAGASRRRAMAWAAGAAIAVVAVVGAVVLATRGDDPVAAGSPGPSATDSATAGTPGPGPTNVGSPSAADPSVSASPAPGQDGDPAAGAALTAPVYWVGERPLGFYLYREFRDVPDLGDPVASAVAATMGASPLDPDYLTAWRAPSRLEVTSDGDAITIDVSADALANTSVGSELAERSVQQVVWTATAAAQSDGPVTILVDGAAFDAWGVIALGEPMSRDPAARALLWLDSPLEGSAVGAGEVGFTGAADVFEGHVAWEVTDAAGTVVASGSAQAAMGEFVPYEFTAELGPGGYTVAVWSPDVSGGESPEGPRMWEQTRAFTVR